MLYFAFKYIPVWVTRITHVYSAFRPDKKEYMKVIFGHVNLRNDVK